MLKDPIKVRAKAALTRRWRSFSIATRVLLALSAVFALSYAILGNRLLLGSVATLEMDSTLRAALVARYDRNSVVPLTMVTIDDATAGRPTPAAQTWDFTNATPRDKLADLLRRVTASGPAAVVVDVDLSDPDAGAVADDTTKEQALTGFLQSYAGPPIVFIKRADVLAGGRFALTKSSNFDPIVAGNSHLSWAHALYSTDADGTVRHWNEWLVTCGPAGTSALPAVPLRVLATWSSGAPFTRPAALTVNEPCEPGFAQSKSHIIIYDAGLYPGHDAALSRNLSIISAWQVTDPRVKRDDQTLFTGRAVLIGGTRSNTNDLWRTPVGLLPGIEVMANTVRFAPGQVRESAHAPLLMLLFFLLFCALKLFLRPIVAIVSGVAICGGVLITAGPYATLEAIPAAIVLFVELSLVEECIHLAMDAKKHGWRFIIAPHLRPHSS